MDFGGLLAQFATADNEQRKIAENQLAMVMDKEFSTFVLSMMQVLVDAGKPIYVRQMAGILFKRAISSLSGSILEEKQRAWNALDLPLRDQVKNALMMCLNDEATPVRNAAASAVSAIAKIEVPIHLWDHIFDNLGYIVQDPSVSIEAKSACIETIRYVCEDLEPSLIDDAMSASVLMTLLYCLQPSIPAHLRDEAIQALNIALEYADVFMQSEEQCSRVMEAIYSCCQDANIDVQLHAIVCLNAVFELFYGRLSPYFATFYTVCKNAVEGGFTDLAIQACLSLETLGLVEKVKKDEERSLGLASSCGSELVAVLCVAMTKQQDDDDGETMTVPMAAATCLAAFCEVMKNDVVGIVWPFVSSHITSSDWHLQEASLMVFGCLLHGPDPNFISSVVAEACPVLFTIVLSNSCIAVRDSAAWALSQICDEHLHSVPAEMTEQMLQTLIDALEMEPRVSQHIALALSSICDFITQPDQQTNLLSSCYQSLLQKLLNCSEQSGAANNQLRENAAYALISLITCCANDCEQILLSFLTFVINKSELCLMSYEGEHDNHHHLQRFYCIVLVSLVQRLGSYITDYINKLTEISYKILSSDHHSAHTQAILLFSGIVGVSPTQSLQFITHLLPFIINAIKTPNDVHNCRSAVTCFGDILHMIGNLDELNDKQKEELFLPIISIRDELIRSLLASLSDSEVDRDIKPDLFICLSDIYWEIGNFCLPFASSVMQTSLQAARFPVESVTDDDGVDWLDRLYCSIADLWDSFSESVSNCRGVIESNLSEIMSFVNRVTIWPDSSQQLIKSCVYMFRDLGTAMGPDTCAKLLKYPVLDSLFVRAVSCGDEFAAIATECRDTLISVMKHEYTSW